jgi:hypothetical protein
MGLEKIEAKMGEWLDKFEEKPIESLLKLVIMYVVFKQLFKGKDQVAK